MLLVAVVGQQGEEWEFRVEALLQDVRMDWGERVTGNEVEVGQLTYSKSNNRSRELLTMMNLS